MALYCFIQTFPNDYWFMITFYPFCSAQNKSEASGQKTSTRALGNQVIRKGHMCIQNLGIMKGKSHSSQSQTGEIEPFI